MPNDYSVGTGIQQVLEGIDPATLKVAKSEFEKFLSGMPAPKTQREFEHGIDDEEPTDPQVEEELPWVMNHHSTDYGVWIDYDGSSFKDYYSLRLKDGTVVNCAYPNANTWMADVLAGARTAEGVTLPIQPGTTYVDDQIAQISLVPDTLLRRYVPHAANGVERIKRNRRQHPHNLLPTEDPKVTEPLKIQARHYGLYVGDEQLAGSHRNELKGQLFRRNEDGTWSLDFKAHVDFGATSGFNPKVMKLVKQFGAILRFHIDTTVTCTSDDLVADQVITNGRFEVIQPGRRPDYDWNAYLAKLPPMVLRVHFSHSYAKS